MLSVVCRQEAIRLKRVRYFTGKPCTHGHLAERYTGSRVCVDCSIVHSAATFQRRKARGVDVHAPSRRYAQKHRQKYRALSKAWKLRNAEYDKQRMAQWELANKDKRRAIWKRRLEAKREEINAKAREWHKTNAHRRRGRSMLRKASKICATPVWANRSDLNSIYANCPNGMHVDHVIPLRNPNVCGLHVPWNLQYLLARENLVKGNRL